MKKTVNFKGVGKTELFIIFLLVLLVFWYDVSQNKVSDLGLDHKASIAGGITIPSILSLYLAGLGIVILLTFLMLRAVINRQGAIISDVIAGAVGFVGIIIFYATTVTSFFFEGSHKIPFFWGEVSQVTLYHWGGLFVLGLSVTYFLLTE